MILKIKGKDHGFNQADYNENGTITIWSLGHNYRFTISRKEHFSLIEKDICLFIIKYTTKRFGPFKRLSNSFKMNLQTIYNSHCNLIDKGI